MKPVQIELQFLQQLLANRAPSEAEIVEAARLCAVLKGQLQEAHERQRRMADDAERARGRAAAAETTQEALRRDLEAARRQQATVMSDASVPGPDGREGPDGRHKGLQGARSTDGTRAPSPASAGAHRARAGQTPAAARSAAPSPSQPSLAAAAEAENCVEQGHQPTGAAGRMSFQEREHLIEAASRPEPDKRLRQQLGKVTSRAEQERQKDLLVRAARLRGNDLQRASEMPGSDAASREPSSANPPSMFPEPTSTSDRSKQ